MQKKQKEYDEELNSELISGWPIMERPREKMRAFGSDNMSDSELLGIILSTVFCQGISQQLLQPAMSAKSENTVRKALWIAAPINGFFGVFMICLGLAAKANPEG